MTKLVKSKTKRGLSELESERSDSRDPFKALSKSLEILLTAVTSNSMKGGPTNPRARASIPTSQTNFGLRACRK